MSDDAKNFGPGDDVTMTGPDGGPEAPVFASPPQVSPSGERYKITAELGRGAIGRVLEAVDERLGRRVALKELLPDRAALAGDSRDQTPGQTPGRVTAQAAARFLREARITGGLEHPGIVPVYDLGEHGDGSSFYTMKQVKGETLSARLKQCRSLGDRLRLMPHFLDVCQAMAYAHARGVIHRDLKPGNVMTGEFGETLVLDWGLAKVRGLDDLRAHDLEKTIARMEKMSADQTVPGVPIGTPSYMSPEQAEGRLGEVDERSDVWSLGAMLYEILCGRPPFVGKSAWEVITKVKTEPLLPVRRLEAAAPPELAAICARCLEKDRAKRYANAGEVAAAVAAVARDRELAAVRAAAREQELTAIAAPLGRLMILIGIAGSAGVTLSWVVRHLLTVYDNPLLLLAVWMAVIAAASAFAYGPFRKLHLSSMLLFLSTMGTFAAVLLGVITVEAINYLVRLPLYGLLGVDAVLIGVGLAAVALQTRKKLLAAAALFFPAGVVIAAYPAVGREVLGLTVFVALGGIGLFLRKQAARSDSGPA